MSEQEPREGRSEEAGGSSPYDDLSMNAVPAAQTAGAGEPRGRSMMIWVAAFVVLVVAIVATWGLRSVSNLPPGEAAQQELQEEVQATVAWSSRTVQEATYLAGDRVRLEISPAISTGDEANRTRLREATVEVMEILIRLRPNRDLFIDGYQVGQPVVQGEYRFRSNLTGPSGEAAADIVVHVEGDPEGRMGATASSRGMGSD